MFEVDLSQLSPVQRGMLDLWQQHLDAEFVRHDAVTLGGLSFSFIRFVELQLFVRHVPLH